MPLTSIKTLGVLAALVLSSAQPSLAQTFPTRPIKIITPFAAGQGPDILARLVADKMSKDFGQAVVVENKPGASGFIAFQAAKAAPTDGYTMVQMDSFHIGTQPSLVQETALRRIQGLRPGDPIGEELLLHRRFHPLEVQDDG